MLRPHIAILTCCAALACGEALGPDDIMIVSSQGSPDTLRAIGAQMQLVAVARRDSAVLSLYPWQSSDTSIVLVTPAGLVTAVRPGTAQLTTLTGDSVGLVHTVVVHQAVAEVHVTFAAPTVLEVDTLQAIATPYDANGFPIDSRTTTWSVADTLRARALEDGRIVGRRRGVVSVVATVEGVSGSASLTIEDGLLAATLSGTLEEHACVVDLDGRANCWGGSGLARVEGGSRTYLSVSVGNRHRCGIATDSTAWCWGQNPYGQLGNANPQPSVWIVEPVAPGGGLQAVSIRASSHDVSCAVATTGEPLCWGHNDTGQLGRGTRTSSELDVARPHGTFLATAIDVSTFHGCALTPGGDAWCWGQSGVGGDSSRSLEPSLVPGGHQFTSLAIGGSRSCALDTSGVPWCWGSSLPGQAVGFQGTPVAYPGAPPLVQLTVGGGHFCGLTSDGELWCWGRWRAGLANTDPEFVAPTRFPTTLTFHAIAARGVSGSLCGITLERAVFCWTATEPTPKRILRESPAP